MTASISVTITMSARGFSVLSFLIIFYQEEPPKEPVRTEAWAEVKVILTKIWRMHSQLRQKATAYHPDWHQYLVKEDGWLVVRDRAQVACFSFSPVVGKVPGSWIMENCWISSYVTSTTSCYSVFLGKYHTLFKTADFSASSELWHVDN